MLMLMYEKKMTQVKSLMWKGSHTYSASTLRTSLYLYYIYIFICATEFVCLLYREITLQMIMCFQFDSGSLPPADRSTSHLFSKRVLKATSFIEKSLFHFHTDPPRGGSDICRKQSQTMYSLLPPSPLPCMTPPGRGFNPPTHFPPPPPRTHDLMSPFDHSLQINSTCSRWFSLTSRIRSSSTSCYDQVPTSARNASDQRL